MSIDHNRIKVADLEKGAQNQILVTKTNGELEFSDINNTLDCTVPGKVLDARQGKVLQDNKVDKVTGKSLLSDTEITRLGTLSNYTHPVNHPPSVITQDPNNRFVTDAEKATWNAKQSSLGFTAENVANKNVANGYAGLGADGKLISSQLPLISISNTLVTASQAEMLAVTAETGDIAVRTDLNKSFILKGSNPTLLADWQELLSSTNAVTTVFGRNGLVTAQIGDYTADQITETATKKFQSANQQAFNDATSSIQTQLNSKQPSGTYATGTGSVIGINTGDNAVNSLYNGLVSNATHTGDATGSTALTVKGINGTLLSGLATGILKNTTTTGVPVIAVASDFPILNQNTTGTAGTITGSIAQSQVTNLVTDLGLKVDKVTGKSLLSDTEITRLGTLSNYTHPANHAASIITQDASNRFVTDAEKSTWNAKQSSLGFTAENVANKNVANGYAGLGADGKLISSQLPLITISNTLVTASQAEMLAVIAETGDIAVRTDLNKSFILKGSNPTLLADWQELLSPTSAVTTVFGRNGSVTAQTGDYSADQINETATRKFQSANQQAFNDATSSIQTQLNGKQAAGNYEPAFSKNTAFNKNFGTSSGTITEGNDLRVINGQTAFGWGNHAGLYKPTNTSDVPYKSIINLNTLFTGYRQSSVNTCQVNSQSTFSPDSTSSWGILTSSKTDDATDYGIQTYVSMGDIPNSYVRKCANGTWGSWGKLLTNGNYNSYAPTLTGVGATGTWGINITGNSNTSSYSSLLSRSNDTGNIITSFRNTTAGNKSWHDGNNETDAPVAGQWFNIESMRHSNPSNVYGTQQAYLWGGGNPDMYIRQVNNDVFSPWARVLNSSNYNSYSPTLIGAGASGTWGINISGNAGSATYLPTAYLGGQQLNPQTYFGQGIGLKVAMTGFPSVWADTLWINGYAGGDVLQMCALHTLRNGQPRMFITAQASNATAYGSNYEFLTTYNYSSHVLPLTGGTLTGSINATSGIAVGGANSRTGSLNVQNAIAIGDSDTGFKQNGDGVLETYANNVLVRTDTSGSSVFNVPITATSFIGNASTCNITKGYDSNPDNSHPGNGVRPFYSWNTGQANNATSGYSNGITVGSHPGDPNYGFQIVQNMWDDQLYFRRYNYGWQSWRTVLDNSNYVSYSAFSGAITGASLTVTGDVTAFSDARVKENIRPITNVIERIQASRGVIYDRIDTKQKDNIGFIAQELEATFPELVLTQEDGTKAVKYQNAVAVLFEAIKEQQSQIVELKNLITKLVKS
jgi:hypothetical protein